jgi:hypothetical protein
VLGNWTHGLSWLNKVRRPSFQLKALIATMRLQPWQSRLFAPWNSADAGGKTPGSMSRSCRMELPGVIGNR